MIDEVEFDGFTGKELLEAKGPGYKSFFTRDGKPMSWYEESKGFGELVDQARRQSQIGRQLNLPVMWHVAEAEVARALRILFRTRGWNNITVFHTPPAP
jgi:hypothetical protein